jgi:hypothetical protein
MCAVGADDIFQQEFKHEEDEAFWNYRPRGGTRIRGDSLREKRRPGQPENVHRDL